MNDGVLGIRAFRREDERSLCLATRETVEELLAWMVWCRPDYDLAHARDFVAHSETAWEEGTDYSFAVHRLEDGFLLGSVAVNRVDLRHRCANLAYWVRQSQTSRGVATAASRLAIRFAFARLGLNRLEMFVPVDNQKSRRVAEKLGARLEGTLSEKFVIQGTVHDAHLYSLLASDVEEAPSV